LRVRAGSPVIREAPDAARDADGSEHETGTASPIVARSGTLLDGPFTSIITDDATNPAALEI
jgi:hypothetical protein